MHVTWFHNVVGIMQYGHPDDKGSPNHVDETRECAFFCFGFFFFSLAPPSLSFFRCSFVLYSAFFRILLGNENIRTLSLLLDVESCCAIETPNLLWGVNHVEFAIVWYVWHHRPRIHACGVHINHQNEWNNSFICASKRFTKPLRSPTPTIPTTTNHYLHLHHLSQ